MKENSKIEWPSGLTAIPEMCYESIAPLYQETRAEVFGEYIGFALSCSKHFDHSRGCRGCIQKLEVVAEPNFSEAKMKITHEVLPDKGSCSQLINVNDKLIGACFDEGCIIEIKNFGYKKTFNCDVRAALQTHYSPVNCIASDTKGTQLASGATNGELALYTVREEKVFFLSKQRMSHSCITGLAYLQPTSDICVRPRDKQVLEGENLLIYSTQDGTIGLIDTRCKLAAEFECCSVVKTDQTYGRVDVTALCFTDTFSGQVVYLGSVDGQVKSIDLRHNKRYLHEQNLPDDKCIRRMKEVIVEGTNQQKKRFLAYTNSTKELRILDASTLNAQSDWTCDRSPNDVIQDFCQVGNRLVTCGDNTSIGCWTMDVV